MKEKCRFAFFDVIVVKQEMSHELSHSEFRTTEPRESAAETMQWVK